MLLFRTALGSCGISWSAAGLTRVVLPPARAAGSPGDAPVAVVAAVASITSLLAGDRCDLRDIELDWSGVDPFRRRVLEALRDVGPGEVTTYGELACAIGEPGGARAVGVALANNPWPIVVPCHRVLGAGGALTGFSAPGGVATKRRMLEIEGAPGFVQQPLFA